MRLASQITSVSIVCSTVDSGPDQRVHQSFASLAFVRGIHRWSMNSPHKGPVTRKMFPFDDVIMYIYRWCLCHTCAFMWYYTPIAVNNNLVLHEIWAKSYFRLTKAVNLQLLIIKCLFTTLLSHQCWCILHSFGPPAKGILITMTS